MSLYDETDADKGKGTQKSYKCKYELFDGNDTCILNCDTSNQPIKTTTRNLHLSTSDDTTLVTLSMKDGGNDAPIETPIDSGNNNNISYRKNSSGLSGGAIAGIVIACAVVLIAASIVAMMLRKPTPPLDNTTVVGLKTVDNY